MLLHPDIQIQISHLDPPGLQVHGRHSQKPGQLEEEGVVLKTLGVLVGAGGSQAPKARTIVDLCGLPVLLETPGPILHQLL